MLRMLNPAADSSLTRPTSRAKQIAHTCVTAREVLSPNMFAAIGSPERSCYQSIYIYILTTDLRVFSALYTYNTVDIP